MKPGFLPGEGLLSLVSPNLMILFSPIFSGGRPNIVFDAGGGVCSDSFLPPAGLAGTGGGGPAGGGPGVTFPSDDGLSPGAGGLMLGGGGLEGGLPLEAMLGG